tara:strand:- start:2328 stop:3332 length:1005 start_codon:yes stop_codon:yes gene_type:complete
MSLKFGNIAHYNQNFVEQNYYKNQTVTSASVGVHHILCIRDNYQVSGDADPVRNNPNDGSHYGLDYVYKLTESGSHWASIHNMFYLSGSSKVAAASPGDVEKYNHIFHDFNQTTDLKPFHKNKFYDSASVFYIPQQLFGERIKPGSFQLTARTGSSTTTNKQIVIKDDFNGNLYSSNAHHSQSGTTSISSSENYIGNIFYDLGVAVLTETASWSGSVDYTSVGGKNAAANSEENDYKFWEINFNSVTPIFTSEYTVKINSKDFNATLNNSARSDITGSQLHYRNSLTGSEFKPYFNQIQLYRNEYEEPIIVANLPRAVQVRDDVDLIITFRLDH